MSNANYWCTNAGAGSKNGSSLANAAVFDPADLNTIITIVNGLTLTQTATIKICGDCSATAVATITVDATTSNRIIWQGRDSGDTADATVTISAGSGAFTIFNLTTADYHEWNDITVSGTNQAASNNGWTVGANADYNIFNRCRATACYRGWDTSAAFAPTFTRCRADNNASYGFYCQQNSTVFVHCVAHDNTSFGWVHGNAFGCIAYGNGNDGFNDMDRIASCTAYNNSAAGFHWLNGDAQVGVDLISVGNGGYGFEAESPGRVYLFDCASYNNTSGRSTGSVVDSGAIALTADPFTDAASADFSLNSTAGGGVAARSQQYSLPGATTDTWRDIGASQVRHGILVHAGLSGGCGG